MMLAAVNFFSLMKNLLFLLTLCFAGAMALPAAAQIQLKIELLPDGETYTLFARSESELLPPSNNILHAAKIAVTVPTGSFELASLQNLNGQWQLNSIVQHPIENPSLDYLLFSLEAATDALEFHYGQELPLFSFQNKNGCTGAFEIMHPATDPFLPPNSLNLPVLTEFIVEGVGNSNAVNGLYDMGAADCFRAANCSINSELELMPDNFYQISIVTDASFVATANLEMVQVAVKVPTNFFQIHNLTNLLPGQFSFGNTTRFDGPLEDQNHDYIQFRLNAASTGLNLQPGVKIPLLKFANGGSCQGDSIFLVKNDDAFLPPNSQSANIGSYVKFYGSASHLPICASPQMAAAPCTGCLFTDGLLKLDSVQSANPVVCLGGHNGMIMLFAHGSSNLEFSIDGGQNWKPSGYFGGLPVGNYQPMVRGTKFGCQVSVLGQPVELQASTSIDLRIELPSSVCEGSDVAFNITSPNPLPTSASFAWSGPQGFHPDFSDPVIFNANNYQSGTYTLLLTAPGCDPASASSNLQVNPLPSLPDILSNGPICFGEKLHVSSSADASKFEWYSPLGASTLTLPGLTTDANETYIEPGSPAYLSGNWQVKVTNQQGCTAMSQPLSIQIKPRPQAFAETSGPVCPGSQVQLLSNPLPGATYEWKKQGDSAVFSVQPNPLISNVLVPQTYQLAVWLDGCVSLIPALTTVSLNELPILSPVQQYTPSADCSPKPLNLAANADGVGLNYLWNGPNGFLSQAANPVIAQANSMANGNYTVQATNIFGCSVTETLLVTGIPDPVAMPQIQGAAPTCPGNDVQLSVQAYTGQQVSYQWYKGTAPLFGQTANSLAINSIQPGAEGSYKLRATVNGCTVESASQFLDVLDPPQPNPDFYLSQPCEGGTLQFFSNQNGIANWHWTGPAGFASDSPTPVIYQTELSSVGAYQLAVVGTNGCTANASLLIDGILAVPPTPLVASNSPVCPGSEIQLTVQNPMGVGTVDFEWENANGEPVGTGGPVLTMPANDPLAVPPFLVKTIVNTCPSALSDPVAVQVLSNPVAIAWNGGAICPGETAELFASTQPSVSYAWKVAGQVVSVEQNPVLAITDSTDFQLVVKTNGCNAEATATTSVPVNPVPAISNLTANLTACEGSSVNLSASNSVAMNGTVHYNWTGPNGFSFTSSAGSVGPFPLGFSSIAQQNEGSYTLQLTSSEGCVSAPQSVSVEVGSMPPTPVITVADAQLCEGETLQLDATPATGSTVTYDWFFHDGSSSSLLATTSFPTYFLPSVSASNSGSYYVKTTTDGCQTQASNQAPLSVILLPTGALATNPTTSLTPACEGTDVQLSATLLPGANYHWYGPSGYYSDLPNPVLASVETVQSGDFLVVIGYPQCSTTLAFETEVFVADTPEVPVLTGAATACEGSQTQLSVANAEAGVVYEFYFGQNGQSLQTGSDSLVLSNLNPSQSGIYFSSASLNGCESVVSAPFSLQVVPAQTGTAFAGDDQTICEATELTYLQATPPVVGEGHWTALDGATVVQPAAAATTVQGLLPGENRFVWTLTNGTCPGVGSDTTVVFLENGKAMADFFTLPVNDSLVNINLLENDFIQNLPDFEFTILTKPTKGQLLEDGTGRITYIPYPNAFGEDGFRYRICSMTCSEICDEAYVRISLDGSVAANDCFRPNLITPDGDGLDDVFVIPCAAGWPGSSILIFNRWGSTVFESSDYQNDWGGTYEGQLLPHGTYFYQLRLNDGKGTMLQGFVEVQ
ncbi:MAG: T9SS type B sorting domain-containing protein [Bacteroidetes bacterium]|nr:T9SS type B sorting domain-containing protein [Bacteroidota bacterium]